MTVRNRRSVAAVVVLVAALGFSTLAGCASSSTPACPVPTIQGSQCAIPEDPDGEPPPDGCIAYDPEKNMALNQRWRDRVEIPDDARELGAQYVAGVTKRLSELRNTGSVTADSVRQVFLDAGFAPNSIALLGDDGSVGFGVTVTRPAGQEFAACLYGTVDRYGVTADIGGPIEDGGCLEHAGGH